MVNMQFLTKKNLLIVAVVGVLIFVVARSANAPENTPSTSQPGVNTGVVPSVDLESVGKVVSDPETGREFMSNQIIVEFQPTVTEEESLQMLAEEGGTMLQRFTAAPVFLFQVKDSGDGKGARDIVATLKKDSRVKKVELNFLTTIENTQ